jgi:tetratricopeptide (TPR) repeat protein
LAINPNYLAAHENLGSVLQGLGDKDEAIAEFRKILAIDPNNAAALRKLKELGDR